ncbi:MAG: DUF6093 family protein [Promicromonosporaceae bacterium]|nr:DUF6093 family protein [Promicromonosporaceae bacterium]
MLGDDLLEVLPELRAEAESQMRDLLHITRVGAATTNPETGVVTHPDIDVYGTAEQSAVGKVQTYEAQEARPEAGTSVRTVQRYAVHIPVGSCDPRVGDVVTVVTAAADPQLAGRRYRVVALLHKSLATAQRLGVEEA